MLRPYCLPCMLYFFRPMCGMMRSAVVVRCAFKQINGVVLTVEEGILQHPRPDLLLVRVFLVLLVPVWPELGRIVDGVDVRPGPSRQPERVDPPHASHHAVPVDGPRLGGDHRGRHRGRQRRGEEAQRGWPACRQGQRRALGQETIEVLCVACRLPQRLSMASRPTTAMIKPIGGRWRVALRGQHGPRVLHAFV